jgi:hypothetical protein
VEKRFIIKIEKISKLLNIINNVPRKAANELIAIPKTKDAC